MRTLSHSEIVEVNGAGKSWLADWLAKIGKTMVTVDVVGKPSGSTDVTVKNNFVDVLVNVVWGKQ